MFADATLRRPPLHAASAARARPSVSRAAARVGEQSAPHRWAFRRGATVEHGLGSAHEGRLGPARELVALRSLYGA